mgnify:CR=1 FL=1
MYEDVNSDDYETDSYAQVPSGPLNPASGLLSGLLGRAGAQVSRLQSVRLHLLLSMCVGGGSACALMHAHRDSTYWNSQTVTLVRKARALPASCCSARVCMLQCQHGICALLWPVLLLPLGAAANCSTGTDFLILYH